MILRTGISVFGKVAQFCTMKRLSVWAILLAMTACQSSEDNVREIPVTGTQKDFPQEVPKKKQTPAAFLVNGIDTLVPVNTYNKQIFWDLRYATSDNFMHRVLYDTLKTVYVQKDVALRLAECQQLLSRSNPQLHLLVYDGVRPLSVQWEMWNALDSIPPTERGKFVSNPRNGSVHNYGAAVDITICNQDRTPLDMGAGYDDIRKIAYPELESQYLATGELTSAHIANRNLLRKIMRSQRFINIPSEWWHFNACPRAQVKRKYAIVQFELSR